MAETFTTTIFQVEGMDATAFYVPSEVIAALGSGKRPRVTVTLNGYTFRITVAPYGDAFIIGVNQAHRAAARVEAGDEVEVTLALDTQPRTVDVPADLAAALAAQPGARAAFDVLSYTKRKEMVRQVEEAKAPETRARRIARIVAQMAGG